MPGTHYTLDRDKSENINPMERIKDKPCRRCGTVKLNNFQHFGRKLWKTRTTLTTNDICLDCQKAKVSVSMKARWTERRAETEAYHQAALAMALTVPLEPVKVVAVRVEPVIVIEDEEDLGGIRPISLSESVQYFGSDLAVANAETESERLMREFLSNI